jgi:hypothetical protein
METAIEMAGSRVVTEDDLTWHRIGRAAGYLVGIGFLCGTLLFILTTTNLLVHQPLFHRTAAGPLQDEANFWAAVFNQQHRIVGWIIARDTVAPAAWVALIVLALAIRQLVGDRPQAQLMVTFFLIGGILETAQDLLFLGSAGFFRFGGWTGHPAMTMAALGRDYVTIDNLTIWPEAFANLVCALGIVFLGQLCRRTTGIPRWVGLLAYMAALALVGSAIAEAGQFAGADTVRNILSSMGALIALLLGFWFAWFFGRLEKQPMAVPSGVS